MEMDNVQNEVIIETAIDSQGTCYSNYSLIKHELAGEMQAIKSESVEDTWEINAFVKSEYADDMERLPDHDYEDKKVSLLEWNECVVYEDKQKDLSPNFNILVSNKNSKKENNSANYEHTSTVQESSKIELLDQNTNYDCGVCGKYFKEACLLKNHVRVHFIEKKFICDICEKRFAISNHLKNHYLVHTGEKNFECSECSKTFRQKGHLLNHLRMHMGVKKFSCPLCSKRFTQNVHMKNHLKTHTGEKNYSCKICYKQFLQSGHLQIHMAVHTGERRYECSSCGMRFKQSGHLNSHLKTHKK